MKYYQSYLCVCPTYHADAITKKPQNVDDYLSKKYENICIEYNQLSEMLDILAPFAFQIIHKDSMV